MSSSTFDPTEFAPAWQAFQQSLPVKMDAIQNETEYDRMLGFMQQLLDMVGDDENHELAGLLDWVGQLMENYEAKQHVIPDAAPHQVLRFLMDQHQYKQVDLAAELGGQSVVSAILNGEREINAKQARALAERFGVSVAAFI